MVTGVRAQASARRLLAVVVTVLLALGVVSATPGRALAGPSEGDFFGAVNAARAAAGVPRLAWADDLAAVARRQAERMARADDLFHNPQLGAEVSGWQVVSENIGYGPSWGAIQDAFMASPDHRANLLDPEVTQLGVGTYVGRDGRLWVSQVFRLPYGASPPSGGGSGAGSAPSTASTGYGATSAAVAAPSPEQVLRERIAAARDQVDGSRARTADPLREALDFSTVMATVGG